MTKALKILNKYQIKDMLLTGNIQYENFYKEELIQICKVANEMIENLLIENQKQKEVIDRAKKRVEKGIFVIPKDVNEILCILKAVE